MSDNRNINKLNLDKKIIENSNINFLIGSGASIPFFGVLSNIENWLTALEQDKNLPEKEKLYLKAIFYNVYFNTAMKGNLNILKENFLNKSDDLSYVKNNYKKFFETIYELIFKRKSSLSKQINIFTTNIDIFHEYILDELNYDFNDGFWGRFNPKLDLSSFRRTFHKESLFFNKISEIPIFNIYKIHGSVTWKYENNEIIFDLNLSQLKKIESLLKSINLPTIDKDKEYEEVKNQVDFEKLEEEKEKIEEFIKAYEQLQIINPTKEKFQETVFRKNHYELLRIFANELEKENTILIVFGFSFADEHIRDIVIRALNYNPLLNIFVFDYNGEGVKAIENEKSKIKNNNLHIIKPDENNKYNFETINKEFLKILNEIKDTNEKN